jgi:5-methyltetrahydrofolate--homocysteine methyltransferase
LDAIKEIKEKLLDFQIEAVGDLTQKAIDQGIEAKEILQHGLISGMNLIGEQFKEAEIFVPQVLLAAKAMNQALQILEPILAGKDRDPAARVILGTVQQDVHDIGKNLVGIMLKGSGFEVYDVGTNVPSERFIEKAQEHKAHLICMSSLLTTSMPFMKACVESIRRSGIKDIVKTMVGGAVVTQRYADEIGADGYAPDAGSAVGKAKELLLIDQ